VQQRLVNRIDHLMVRVAEREFARVEARFNEALSASVVHSNQLRSAKESQSPLKSFMTTA
jgi:hypothetical protein